MKIPEMTKEELVAYMYASKELHTFDPESKSWQRAFELAKLSGLENMSMDCSGCIRKVHEWLTSSK